jgi:putative transcriptional regulator
MVEANFNVLIDGLSQAESYLSGEPVHSIIHSLPMPDVAEVREGQALNKAAFATTFHLDKSAVCDWEQGRRIPDRTARVFLTIVEKIPTR